MARTKSVASPVDDLLAPRRDCSQAPFWFWNGPLDARQLSGQVAEMARQGVHGCMPHPRYGMDRRQYLEKPYWQAFDAVVKQALASGSRVMLYDEYNWPSGGAGGRVVDGHPEFYPRGLDCMARDVQGPCRIEVHLSELIPSESEAETPEAILALFLTPADSPLTGSDSEVTELPAEHFSAVGQVAKDGLSARADIPAGARRLLIFYRARTSSTSPLDNGSGVFVDYLNPKVTRRFIALTHEAYRRRYGRHFGKTIPCIFTDEPQAMSAGPFPWTAALPEEFLRRRGYDLLAHLPALVDDRYPGGWRHRAAYWQSVAELIDESFFAPIQRWCKRAGIAFTGHVFEEDITSWPAAPHLMNWLRRLDWPGIDALGVHIQPTSAKIAVSVAHLQGKPHFLCEALGLARGWNTTLGLAKRAYNFLALMGVDVLVPHAFFQTLDNPRVECPPSYFEQNPYWKYYRTLADMTSRLCAFNRIGTHVAPLAVYYPIESLWADSTGGKGQNVKPWQCKSVGNGQARRTVDAFNAALMAFSARQVDCDVVDAKAVLEGRVGDGQLTIGPESFGCVVLPAVRTIDPQALHQLMEFVSSGGTLLVIDAWPTRAYPQGQMPDLQAWLGGPLPQKGQVATVGRGRVIFVADAADLASELPEQVRPNIRFLSGQNGCAYAAVRREAARTAWLVVNDGAQPLELDIELPAHLLPAVDGGLTWVDPVSGLCGRQPCEAGSSGLRTRLMLEDTQAMILVAGGASVPEAAPAVAPVSRSARTIELDQWTFQLAPTSLEERWTDKLNPELVSLPVWKAIGRGWRRMAGWTQRDFDDSEFRRVSTPRGGALLEDEVALLRSVLPPGARAIQLPLPTDGEFMIHVNGQLLGKFLGPPPKGSLDIHKHVSGIGDVVAIEVSSMAGPSGLVDAPRILCGPVKLPQLTAWGNMGLWWYSGRAVYRTSFTLAKAPSVARLDLGDVRHYVEVWVNGRRADELLWPPYRLNVAGLLRRGTNRLSLVVSNSLASRFLWDSWGTRCGQGWGIGPKEEPSGLLGPVRLAAE